MPLENMDKCPKCYEPALVCCNPDKTAFRKPGKEPLLFLQRVAVAGHNLEEIKLFGQVSSEVWKTKVLRFRMSEPTTLFREASLQI